MGISGGATSTLIPLCADALGGNLFNVGIISAATSVASVPAFILWGGACDRRGRRKPFLLIGFLGSGIALLAMAASRTMSEFYLANLLAGFLGAASGPAGTVLLMETSKREDWPARLAIMSRMTATGWVAGLALGILWLAAGPDLVGRGLTSMRYLFAIGAALAFSAGFVVQLATREAAVRVDRKDVHLVDAHPRVERGRYLPMRIVHFVGPLTDSSGNGLPRPGLIVALHAGVGACWAMINVASCTLVSHLAPEGARARALGAFNAVQGFGSIFGPLLGGLVAALFGYGPAFVASVALVLAGTGILWTTRISDA